jgi:hypothetical protein
MIKKYNLALIPTSKKDEITIFAKKLSYLADNYLIGEGSLPHVTLCQFNAEESDIRSIWEKVNQGWQY